MRGLQANQAEHGGTVAFFRVPQRLLLFEVMSETRLASSQAHMRRPSCAENRAQSQCQETMVRAMRCAEVGDRAGECTGYGDLGAAYHSLGQFDKAVDFYQKSPTIALEVGLSNCPRLRKALPSWTYAAPSPALSPTSSAIALVEVHS